MCKWTFYETDFRFSSLWSDEYFQWKIICLGSFEFFCPIWYYINLESLNRLIREREREREGPFYVSIERYVAPPSPTKQPTWFASDSNFPLRNLKPQLVLISIFQTDPGKKVFCRLNKNTIAVIGRSIMYLWFRSSAQTKFKFYDETWNINNTYTFISLNSERINYILNTHVLSYRVNFRTYLACPDNIIPEKRNKKCVWQGGTVIVGQLLRHKH